MTRKTNAPSGWRLPFNRDYDTDGVALIRVYGGEPLTAVGADYAEALTSVGDAGDLASVKDSLKPSASKVAMNRTPHKDWPEGLVVKSAGDRVKVASVFGVDIFSDPGLPEDTWIMKSG